MGNSAAIAFDTLKFANRLKAAGIKPEHAEAEAEAIAEVFEVNISGLATKADLKHLEERFDAKFELQRRDIDAKFAGMDAKHESLRKDIATMEQRIVLKLGRIVAAGIGLIGVVLPIMLKLLHVF